MKKFLLLLFLISSFAKAQITTLYPETITLKQINGAEKERLRLCQGHKKYDRQPTGFYVEAGKKLVVDVEIHTAADNNVMPVLTIGTMGFNVDGRNTGTNYVLKSGTNTITATVAGLIWLSFTSDANADPKGVAQITFAAGSEQVRAPMYVYGVTTDSEMNSMIDIYKTPDVLFYSDYAVVVATRDAARTYYNVKREEWMNSIHTLLALEDTISGMDNNDANPVHHRLKAGEIRYLLVQNTSASPHANSAGYTGYPSGSISRYLTTLGTSSNNSWMLGHELGHQHQQPAWTINQAGESTVNIYSYTVERHFAGNSYNRTSATRWEAAHDTYLKLPLTKRVYDMNDNALQAVTGFNRDELRFMVWEQLFLLFGDQFYKNLHRVTREEAVTGGEPDERRAYLIWKASQVSGYDLTEFFNQWGIRVSDAALKTRLRAQIGDALTKGKIFPLPYDVETCMQVTGQQRPDWIPLPLKGITSSAPENTDNLFDRSVWKIYTSYPGVADQAVSGTLPQYMIDGNLSTSFLFVKPGKNYGGLDVPQSSIPSFTVDMLTPHTFNYVVYSHRTGNTSTMLRAKELSIYGSNDSTNFVPLIEHYVVNADGKNANDLKISFDEVQYRYVTVVIEDWDRSNGNTIQIQEFNVGRFSSAEVLPTPEPLKFKVDVTASDNIITSQKGINQVNEDSDYTIHFSLAQNDKEFVVTVEGDTIVPVNDGSGNYSFTVKVINHLQIAILDKSSSGIEKQSGNSFIDIFPNPVKAGESFTVGSQKILDKAKIYIFNMTGQKILEDSFSGGSCKYVLTIPGIYLIRLVDKGEVFTSKIIVE